MTERIAEWRRDAHPIALYGRPERRRCNLNPTARIEAVIRLDDAFGTGCSVCIAQGLQMLGAKRSCHRGCRFYCAIKPPSITSSAPVINEASSEASNSTP